MNNIGKDELNLADLPFAIVSRRQQESRSTIKYLKNFPYTQEWIVAGSSRYGLPTEFDERVFITLLAITKRQNFCSRQVFFKVSNVLGLMQIDKIGGYQYRSFTHSLERLTGVTITARGLFWDNSEERYIPLIKGFHIIDEYQLKRTGVDDNYIVWSQILWRSFESGYMKDLNLAFFFSLKKPLSRRLYRLLDKRLQDNDKESFDLLDIGARMGMDYNYPSEIARKIRLAAGELKFKGFLKNYRISKNKFTAVNLSTDR